MRNQKGFTLIELVIVVAIISILAIIAIPQFSSYRNRAYTADSKSVLHTAALAQEAYFVDNNTYTTNITALENNYALVVGEVELLVPDADSDSYVLRASHRSSQNWFRFEGPGGIVVEE